ncbi:Uncharacterised protein [Klebsiella pneumoniae]|nr:Uncharacterised protein [Klebsiella pneumoniae]
MSNEDEFFAEMHPQIAQIIGIAVMQLLVEKREPSREALIEMIQVLWQGDQVDLPVELALDVLILREEWGNKNPARWPGWVRLLAIQSKFLCCGKEALKPCH